MYYAAGTNVEESVRPTPRPALRAALLLLPLVAGLLTAHPFYVSICQIDHNPETAALEVTVKVFTDDLESVISREDEPPPRLGDPGELPDADARIADYLAAHLQVWVNGERVTGRYLGKEVEMEATFCYVEIPGVARADTVEVLDDIFMEQFDTQTNLVHVTVGGTTLSMLLTPRDRRGRGVFENEPVNR